MASNDRIHICPVCSEGVSHLTVDCLGVHCRTCVCPDCDVTPFARLLPCETGA